MFLGAFVPSAWVPEYLLRIQQRQEKIISLYNASFGGLLPETLIESRWESGYGEPWDHSAQRCVQRTMDSDCTWGQKSRKWYLEKGDDVEGVGL